MILVKNRQLLMSNNEQYLGTVYDSNTSNREFKIDRINTDGTDFASMVFKLDICYMDTETYDVCDLDTAVLEDHVLLTWTVPETVTAHEGAAKIQLRAFDSSGSLKWSSYVAVVYISESIQESVPSAVLSELEQLETRLNALKVSVAAMEAAAKTSADTAESAKDDAAESAAAAKTSEENAAAWATDLNTAVTSAAGSTAEAKQSEENAAMSAEDSERWAVGQKNGVDVDPDDETYHNNAKYWANVAEDAAGGDLIMLRSVYDPNQKKQDMFKYADDLAAANAAAAQAAQTTANTAVSNAADAQSTADTAVSNAADAQNAADAAQETADAAIPMDYIAQELGNNTDRVPSLALLNSVNSTLDELNSSLSGQIAYPWKVLQEQVTVEGDGVTLNVPTAARQLLLHIGYKNNTQAYGGTSLFMIQGLPCFVPIYYTGTLTATHLVYVFWNNTAKALTIGRKVGDTPLLVNVFYS